MKKKYLIRSCRFSIYLYAGNQGQSMACSGFSDDIIHNVILLVLIGIILGTAGCIEPFTGSDPSVKNTDPAIAPGNETNASSLSGELMGGVQGFVARPVKSLDRSMSGPSTIPVVRTIDTTSLSGPALSAKGNEVNMTEVQLQKETLLPQ